LKCRAKKSQSHQGQEGLPSILRHGRLQKQGETPRIKAPTRRTNQRGTYIKPHHLEK
jgi:hypothetical protein